MNEIYFYNEECDIPSFFSPDKTQKWINQVANNYSFQIGELSYIFCSDDYILNVNQEYLNHDYYTDVITFDYTNDNLLSGDVFISLDTVKSNSELFKTSFEDEMNRVIIHAILHLIGFKDKSEEEEQEMRAKENECLELLKTI